MARVAGGIEAVAVGFQRVVQLAEFLHRGDIGFRLVAQLDADVAGDETEHRDARWQFGQHELDVCVFLEVVHAEALEIGNDHVARPLGFIQAKKIIQRLGVRGVQILTRAFVFGQQPFGPEQIDAAIAGAALIRQLGDLFFVDRDAAALHAKNMEELVPEGLRFGALAGRVLPFARELGRAIADFRPGQGWHGSPRARSRRRTAR